jgi:hypothetical protein
MQRSLHNERRARHMRFVRQPINLRYLWVIKVEKSRWRSGAALDQN